MYFAYIQSERFFSHSHSLRIFCAARTPYLFIISVAIIEHFLVCSSRPFATSALPLPGIPPDTNQGDQSFREPPYVTTLPLCLAASVLSPLHTCQPAGVAEEEEVFEKGYARSVLMSISGTAPEPAKAD
jgi:hypothetical protein